MEFMDKSIGTWVIIVCPYMETDFADYFLHLSDPSTIFVPKFLHIRSQGISQLQDYIDCNTLIVHYRL